MSVGIYVHLPFCRVHCTYCPFVVSTDVRLQDQYTEALLREIDARGGGAVDTIFFGGGTPSRPSLENLGRVVGRLRERFDVAGDAELSLEANPEDITPQSLAAWRGMGVNRVSIGVQSFHDAELRPLGRVHGPQRARDAIRDTVASGARTSVDLILGLPQQTAESFRETLEIAVASGVGHVSLYMLDLEEGTMLARQVESGKVALPDDDLVASLYSEAVVRLAAAGLQQYEISNFGDVCRHNSATGGARSTTASASARTRSSASGASRTRGTCSATSEARLSRSSAKHSGRTRRGAKRSFSGCVRPRG